MLVLKLHFVSTADKRKIAMILQEAFYELVEPVARSL